MKEKICGIYCIENLINGNKYIGYSSDISKRWRFHRYELNRKNHVNNYLQNAWDLYGEDNFSLYIIEECDKELLQEKEIYYISEFDTVSPNGYNLTSGGDGIINLSDETRAKISKANSGKNNPMYGKARTFSDETKEKISNALMGKGNPMYGKRGEDNPNYGKVHSDETKIKISKILIGNTNALGHKLSTETKAKLSDLKMGEKNPMYGKVPTDEHRAKISEGLRRYHKNKR